MEVWRLMLGMAAMLVLYAVLAVLLNVETGPAEIGLAIVFAAIGLYAGQLISDRLYSDEE